MEWGGGRAGTRDGGGERAGFSWDDINLQKWLRRSGEHVPKACAGLFDMLVGDSEFRYGSRSCSADRHEHPPGRGELPFSSSQTG